MGSDRIFNVSLVREVNQGHMVRRIDIQVFSIDAVTADEQARREVFGGQAFEWKTQCIQVVD